MIKMSVSPARTASSTTYWIAGLSTNGSISLGWALVAGRNRVPRPAAGNTAFRTDALTPRIVADEARGAHVESSARLHAGPHFHSRTHGPGPHWTQEPRARRRQGARRHRNP